MGIKQLSKFLRKHCTESFTNIHLSNFQYKKVAIDISLYICKFKASVGDKWLASFVSLVTCLRRNEIHCVFIYDSGDAVPEKSGEREERCKQRDASADRLYKLEEMFDKYLNLNEVDPELYEISSKLYALENKGAPVTRLLGKNTKTPFRADLIERKIEKMKSNAFSISKEDFDTTKRLFDILSIPWFVATLEAETVCSDLCIAGKVDYVLTEDTDVLAYSSPNYLSKLDMYKDCCILVDYKKILEELKLTCDSFLDFCIMCGTDYNKNIFKVGPEKAYSLILKYGSIGKVLRSKEIRKMKMNPKVDIKIKIENSISALNYKRTREIFRDYEKCTRDVPYCGEPDFSTFAEFIVVKNIKCDLENTRKAFVKEIIIEDDDDEE